MKRKAVVLIGSLCCIANLGGVMQASAEDFPLVVGGEYAAPGGVIANADSGDRVLLAVGPFSSYCCSVIGQSLSTLPRFTGVFDLLTGIGLDAVPNGTAAPAVPTAENHPNPDAARWCFRMPADPFFRPPQKVVLPLAFGESGDASASNIRVDCQESTLFLNFNINSTEYNVLELSNRTRGLVTLSASFGDGNPPFFDWLMQPSSRFDYFLNEWFGTHPPNELETYGTLRITHNAPLGGLHASLSRYRIDPSANAGIDLKGTSECTLRPR